MEVTIPPYHFAEDVEKILPNRFAEITVVHLPSLIVNFKTKRHNLN